MLPHAAGASIVNLGSISSFIGQPGMATYNATKGAVMQITRCGCVCFDSCQYVSASQVCTVFEGSSRWMRGFCLSVQ
jgi:hypothetical protein